MRQFAGTIGNSGRRYFPRKLRHGETRRKLKKLYYLLRFQPGEQTLGVSTIDGFPVVLGKAGVLDQTIVRELVISDGGVAAVQDLRNWNDVLQGIQRRSPSRVRRVEIEFLDFV